jgi:quinol monooxygenase YgiN
MATLDINTSGAWRTVVRDLTPAQETAVKAACQTLVDASHAVAGKRSAISFRLRDALGAVYLHCEWRESEGYAAWRPPAFARERDDQAEGREAA